MTASMNVSTFISALAINFVPPVRQHEDPKAYGDWLQSMARILKGYPSHILTQAADDITRTRKNKYFPLPAEVREACQDAVKREELYKPRPLPLDPSQRKDLGEWRVKLADDLIRCEIGREAAREGWILSLHDFCRNNGRLPAQHEIGKCREGARGFDIAFRDCVSGNGGDMGRELAKLGDSMLRRREELRRRVLGEAA